MVLALSEGDTIAKPKTGDHPDLQMINPDAAEINYAPARFR